MPVLRLKQSACLSSLVVLSLLPLGACSNSPWANQLEQSFAADPRLQADAADSNSTSSPNLNNSTAQLPANFPAEIPRYPNAELIDATGSDPSTNIAVGTDQTVQTRWQTADSAIQVRQFYQQKFQAEGWQLDPTNSDAADRPLKASRDGLQVTWATTANQAKAGNTEFTIDYQFGQTIATDPAAAPSTNPDASSSDDQASGQASTNQANSANSNIPQPGDPDFIGPVLPTETAQASPSPTTQAGSTIKFADVDQAPAELRPYITDLVKLGALHAKPVSQAEAAPIGDKFNPNGEISRRDYARWLVAANNLIYANQPARKIRIATNTDRASFQDVPASDPDFGVIQGLANAGLIASSLSGDSTTVTFRPDAPLTRQEMILWKVPVDTRQALPNASIDSIQKTWGFQDAAKIDPRAMRAVLADFENGDLANIRRAYGYTTLFQPQKTVSRAEAAAVLWQFGVEGSSLTAKDAMLLNKSVPGP